MIKLILLTIVSFHVDTIMIPWGSGKGELGIKTQTREDAGPNMGPLAFDVENGRIVFIDTYNSRLEYFDRSGNFLKEIALDKFPNNVILWNGKIYLSTIGWKGIQFLKLNDDKLETITTIKTGKPLVGNSVEFLKDYGNGALFISYKIIDGEKIISYFTIFREGIKKEDFIKGDPSIGKNSTVIGYDAKGIPISVWFDDTTFHFRHGNEIFTWNPVFYAQMHGAPYRIDKDGTLYIVNYPREGVEVLVVRW